MGQEAACSTFSVTNESGLDKELKTQLPVSQEAECYTLSVTNESGLDKGLKTQLPVGRTMDNHMIMGSFQNRLSSMLACPVQKDTMVSSPRRIVVSLCFIYLFRIDDKSALEIFV